MLVDGGIRPEFPGPFVDKHRLYPVFIDASAHIRCALKNAGGRPSRRGTQVFRNYIRTHWDSERFFVCQGARSIPTAVGTRYGDAAKRRDMKMQRPVGSAFGVPLGAPEMFFT